MNEWTRLLLYGTYDGFSRSTEGENNINLILDNGDRVEVPNHFVKNASDFVEKNKIKLKDIIARMEGLNGLTRIEWLDDILYKFGNSYGASKYKSGYEQGKLEGELVAQQLKGADKIRQELNKPVVPPVVSVWYQINKDNLYKNIAYLCANWTKSTTDDALFYWMSNTDNFIEILIDMHRFGYTVEKEKLYRVKMKKVVDMSFLNHDLQSDSWLINNGDNGEIFKTHHTRKELEQAGFGWVFDCPGIEIEEVKE